MPFYYDFHKAHDNAFLRAVRRIYKPLGFYRGYNFPLWIIFGFGIFGFGLARAMYLDIDGTLAEQKVINGDWESWSAGHEYVGIVMHLAAVIPACFLVPWQFLPVVRHRFILFHRVNGYILVILLLLADASAYMILRTSMGGDLGTQTTLGLLGVYTITSVILALVNIKRLQIDQHRAWMVRTWIVMGVPITQRIIQIPTYRILTRIGSYYFPMACHTIAYVTLNTAGPEASEALLSRYAACREDPINGVAAVNVKFRGTPEEIGVAISASFVPSIIVAFFLHAAGVEIYFALTTAERDRLKQVSYEKQVARGWKRAGDAGLTPDKFGDLPQWQPAGVSGRRDSPNGSEDSMVKEPKAETVV